VIICCGYRHEILTDYCGDGTSFKLQVEYLIEDTPIGRGGAIRSAMHYLGPTPNSVLALNGDIITNLNPNDVLSHHARSNVLATLVSVPLVTQYGIVEIGEHSLVKSFCEKPELPYWINAGIYAFAPGMQSLLPDVGDHEVETFPALAKQGQLAVFTTRSFWRAVDTVKDLTEIEAKFENGYSQIGSQS
jgi:NDP-sugar pyrophosphorylase family protein